MWINNYLTAFLMAIGGVVVVVVVVVVVFSRAGLLTSNLTEM